METVEKRFEKGEVVFGPVGSMKPIETNAYEYEILEEFENPAYGDYDLSSKYLYKAKIIGIRTGTDEYDFIGDIIGVEPEPSDSSFDVVADGHIELPE